MSWKHSTLALIALAVFASASTAGGDDAPRPRLAEDASRAAASEEAGPLRAAPPTDKELIEKQKVCPVTDEQLGSMGPPVKVAVKGRTVFLCCAGCKKKLLADPDKYLKKLDAKK